MLLYINKKSGSLSVISNHRLENDYEMNWNDVKIVNNEPYSYSKRVISEMHIKKQPV